MLDSKLWSCSDATFRVAIFLLLSANHEPKWHRRIEILRGQTVRSLTQISDACKLSRNTARYALKILIADNFIVLDEPFGTHQGHRLTICNYDTYQSKKTKEHTLTDTPTDPRTDTRTAHKQEVKKNDKNDKNIPEGLGGAADFLKTWKEWVKYRKTKIKVQDWGLLFKKQLEWLSENSPEIAIKILNKSMRQGWAGLFPLKREDMTPENKIDKIGRE